MADSSHIVSIYFDGQKKVVTSKATTVQQVLEQSGVNLGQGDLVDPAAGSTIPVGFFNINVYRSRPVVVIDGDNSVTVQTASQSPRLIAEAAGLKTYPEDTFEMANIDDVADMGVVGQKVVIHRAILVFLEFDGQKLAARSQQHTVGGVLDERDVALGPQDTVEPGRDTLVSGGMTIVVNRVKIVMLKENQSITREVSSFKDNTIEIGNTQVQTEGNDGVKELTYKVNYQNGVENHRQLVTWAVRTEPVNKVILVGTKVNYSADPATLGKELAALRGWTDDQWTALYSLWSHESGWNPAAKNSSSGACGIPQAYPCSKITDKSTAGQITWGLDYITDKYGTPAAAWAYWQKNHSY